MVMVYRRASPLLCRVQTEVVVEVAEVVAVCPLQCQLAHQQRPGVQVVVAQLSLPRIMVMVYRRASPLLCRVQTEVVVAQLSRQAIPAMRVTTMMTDFNIGCKIVLEDKKILMLGPRLIG
jgi:hypothetical protein